MTEHTKRCRRCKNYKPLAEFKKAANRPQGVSSWCKKCSNDHYKDNEYAAKRWEAEKRERKEKLQPANVEPHERR
jgi:NADH:ubiquinone oxidoreductase subunit